VQLDRNPFDGKCPELIKHHGVETEFGRLLRKAEAQTRLKEMEAAEANIVAEESRNREVDDRLAQMEAMHHLNMQYLLEFGVAAEERHALRTILQQVADRGNLTIHEAANQAQSQHSIACRSSLSSSESEEDPSPL